MWLETLIEGSEISEGVLQQCINSVHDAFVGRSRSSYVWNVMKTTVSGTFMSAFTVLDQDHPMLYSGLIELDEVMPFHLYDPAKHLKETVRAELLPSTVIS